MKTTERVEKSVASGAAAGAWQPPEGYVLVPKEPTDAMDKAGAYERELFDPRHNDVIVARAIYRAMLAAAPIAAEPPQGSKT